MCGVVAIYAYGQDAPPVDREELVRVRDKMTARGPDGAGEWFAENGRVGLGHRRLAIIDLSLDASQPMVDPARGLAISYNGEIYNFRELRKELARDGYEFRTRSDTEVLLRLYAQRGVDMLHALRGMYAFALWDDRKGALLVVRDRYGIKPMYYTDNGSCVRVASQVRALLAGGRVPDATDPAGIVGFYLFGSVPEPRTTIRNIRSVPSGSFLWIDSNGCGASQRYWSVAESFARRSDWRESHPGERCSQIQNAVRESVACHLVADVPVGVFLSAGIDSGAISGLMQRACVDSVASLTLDPDTGAAVDERESGGARVVAEQYGLRHEICTLTDRDIETSLEAYFDAMDQPSIDGLNTWLISREARTRGWKVAVSGLGGDELFGGYPSFRDIPRMVRWSGLLGAVPGLGTISRSLLRQIASLTRRSPKLAGLVEFGSTYAGAYLLRRGLFMPWELSQVLPPETVAEGLRDFDPLEHIAALLEPDPGTPYGRVATLEASFYLKNQLLRDADWAGMAHALEIRTPLVDGCLTQTVAPLIGAAASTGAADFKRVLGNAPEPPLPSSILRRAKTGFTLPIARWLQQFEVLAGWQQVPFLRHPGCHWSRRWAHVIGATVH